MRNPPDCCNSRTKSPRYLPRIPRLTNPALAFMLASLVFGSSLLEQWDTVGTQLLYGLFIFVLILHCQRNHLRLRRPVAPASH